MLILLRTNDFIVLKRMQYFAGNTSDKCQAVGGFKIAGERGVGKNLFLKLNGRLENRIKM